MNANQIKFYKTLADFFRAEQTAANVKKYMTALNTLDTNRAAEVWEYLATAYETETVYCDTVFRIFYDKSAKNTVKVLTSVPAIRKMVFGLSAHVGDEDMLTIESDLILGNKLADAEEILKCIVRNPNAHFGKYMKKLVERLFIEILKKNGNARIAMSRKTCTLLLTYIAKIKTDERALLEQRIKEIN